MPDGVPTAKEQARYDEVRAAVHHVEARNDWEAAAAEVAPSVFLSDQRLLIIVKMRARYPKMKDQDLVPWHQVQLTFWAEERGTVWSGCEAHGIKPRLNYFGKMERALAEG